MIQRVGSDKMLKIMMIIYLAGIFVSQPFFFLALKKVYQWICEEEAKYGPYPYTYDDDYVYEPEDESVYEKKINLPIVVVVFAVFGILWPLFILVVLGAVLCFWISRTYRDIGIFKDSDDES